MPASRSARMGVDYTATYSSTTAPFDLGEYDHGADNTEWVFVRASTAFVAGQCVSYDENWLGIPVSVAAVGDQHGIGFAQTAQLVNQYGWIAISGSNITHRALKSCAADVALYATASAGYLDDAVTTGALVRNVVCVTTADATTTRAAVEIIAHRAVAGNLTEPANAG